MKNYSCIKCPFINVNELLIGTRYALDDCLILSQFIMILGREISGKLA